MTVELVIIENKGMKSKTSDSIDFLNIENEYDVNQAIYREMSGVAFHIFPFNIMFFV